MKTASWILLAVVAGLTILGSLGSLGVAYFANPANDNLARGLSVKDLGDWRPEALTATRARRGTAAAYGLGYGLLLMIIVLVPYRRGEVWAWWAILAGALVVFVAYALRMFTLGTNQGVGVPGAVQLGVIALALALDAGRLRRTRPNVSGTPGAFVA
jgi:hypothetical protein